MNDDGWTTLDIIEPQRALRRLAGLSLAKAARASGLKAHSTIEMNERREGRDGSSPQIGTIAKRAREWGFELRIQVRRIV